MIWQAKEALKESEEEMAKIEAEKGELVQKWKSTLIGSIYIGSIYRVA